MIFWIKVFIAKFFYRKSNIHHLTHEVHPNSIGGRDICGGPVEDVAHALDVVAAVSVVRGLVGLCRVLMVRQGITRHLTCVPDVMQGVSTIQTRIVSRPLMSGILVASLAVC